MKNMLAQFLHFPDEILSLGEELNDAQELGQEGDDLFIMLQLELEDILEMYLEKRMDEDASGS